MNKKYYRYLVLITIIIFSSFNFLSAQIINDTIKDEKIVIPYSLQPSWMVNSSISTVKNKKIPKSLNTNIGNILVGRLAGLTVMPQSNEPGEDSPIMYIRGINTFGTGKSILVIVDGIESSYESLVPEEIESISILKDASATSIFGSRGANGVLLVTTKRGIESPMQVSVNVQQGIRQIQRLPDFLDSYNYANLYNEALVNDGKAPIYSQDDLMAYQTGSDKFFHPNVDWYSEVLRKTSPVSNYNLNFRGGNAGVKYFVLLNMLTDNGAYIRTKKMSDNSINQNYKKYNIRTNVDVNINENLSATLLLGTSIEQKSSPKSNNSNSLFELLELVPPNMFPVYNPNGTFGGSSSYSNPLGDILNTGFFTSNTRTFQSVFKLTQKLDFITHGLNASVLASFNNYFRVNSNKEREYAYYSISKGLDNDTIYNKIGDETTLSATENTRNQWRNAAWQVFLNYNNNFDDSNIDALLMYQEYSRSIAGTALPYRYSGLNGRLTYALQKKYIADLSFAYNATENFPKNSRWGLFPALSLGWIVSNENFLKENSFFDYLKIRGSYGLTGNDDIGGTRFMFNPQPYVYGKNYFFGTNNTTVRGLFEGQIPNNQVTWEKEYKLNFGLEVNFLENFDFTLDFFSNTRNDILTTPNRTISRYLGFELLPELNLGKTRNQGFEAELLFQKAFNPDFTFYSTLNIWYAKNKVIYNDEEIQEYEYLYRTGHRINQPFRLEAIGFFEDYEDINNSPIQTFTSVRPGDIKYKDQNNDGLIDQNDHYPLGNQSLPMLSAGFETGFKFKNFDMSAFFHSETLRSVYLNNPYYRAFQNNGKITSIALDRWTENNKTASYPRLSAENNLNNFQPSTFWERDGSFIKLRHIEFGYNFSNNLLNKIKFQEIRAFIVGENVLSFDFMDFTDPEILTGYPSMRTYSIGLNFKF